MKTILICSVQAPFIKGGAEILVADLRPQLEQRGYRVDVVNVPFKWYPVTEIVRQALSWRLLDLTECNGVPIDLVIPTKFPSYLVRHPRKVTWLIHQHREAYDLFGSAFCSLTQSEEDRKIREAIHGLDTATLAESRSIYTISHNVTNRLKKYNGLSGVTLYPPPQYVGRYRFDEYGDFLFFAGRLDRLKRLDLVIDALVHTRSAIRLLIAGVGPVENELRAQIERLGLQARVQLLGFVGEEDLLTLYASCRAAIYLPMNEDYGYVTVEAFFSRKPVVTTMDAGGPLEFVTDGQTGFVAEAEPRALAGAVERLWDTSHARLHEMGAAGFEIVKDIGWDRVIDCLTEGC